jgi:hypothetical protein
MRNTCNALVGEYLYIDIYICIFSSGRFVYVHVCVLKAMYPGSYRGVTKDYGAFAEVSL